MLLSPRLRLAQVTLPETRANRQWSPVEPQVGRHQGSENSDHSENNQRRNVRERERDPWFDAHPIQTFLTPQVEDSKHFRHFPYLLQPSPTVTSAYCTNHPEGRPRSGPSGVFVIGARPLFCVIPSHRVRTFLSPFLFHLFGFIHRWGPPTVEKSRYRIDQNHPPSIYSLPTLQPIRDPLLLGPVESHPRFSKHEELLYLN